MGGGLPGGRTLPFPGGKPLPTGPFGPDAGPSAQPGFGIGRPGFIDVGFPRPFVDGGVIAPPRKTPQEILYRMLQGLTPRVMANMLPTMKGVTSSIVSGMGKPPEDFWAEVAQGAPPTYGQNAMSANF